MRTRFQSISISSLLCVLALLLAPSFAAAQSPTPDALAASEVNSVLQRGLDLENEHRWGEALNLYEEALRQNPENSNLRERFDFTRINYDLGRRYTDNSFVRFVGSASEDDALSLYSEVMLKVQAHFVDSPDWRKLVDRGTMALLSALGDRNFTARNNLQLTYQQVDQLGRDLRAALSMRMIRNRHEAREAVLYAGRFTQQQIGLPSAAVVLEYLCGATNSLDDYSSFLTSDQLTDVYSQIDGNFVGLGIEIKAEDGHLVIVRVITGSPAEQAGVRQDDVILSVDGTVTEGLSTDKAASLLQGKEGSVVELTVRHTDNRVQRYRIRRTRVDVPSVDEARIIDPAYGIAYFKLVSFQKTTARDVDRALWDLHRQGMKSLIIDLRGNPGGLLTASVEVADKFVESGTIVSTRGRDPREDFTYPAHRAGTWRVPLVVLVDNDSASASEILAGALRDHSRATVVGVRSYGKGSVQGIFPLGNTQAGLRLTTAKFYSPLGRPFSHVGVQPDVVVHSAAKPVTSGVAVANDQDAFINAALQAAKQKLARR